MNIMKNPAKEIDRPVAAFRRGLERAFNRTYSAFERNPLSIFSDLPSWPAIDVSEDEKHLTLRIDIPGLRPADVDVEVSGNLLTIRGQREEELKDPDRPGRDSSYRHERFSGSVSRTLTLPAYVSAEKIDAKYDQGVLELNVPKIPGAGPKRITVKTV